MFRRNEWIIFRGGVCLDLKHLWVQYEFNKVLLSERGRKELSIIRMWEKLWQKLVCRKRFNLHEAKPILSQQYFFKLMKVLNKENRAIHSKYMIFGFYFSRCVNMPDINALWFFFSKCVDLVPNLTNFEIIFQSA